MPYNLDENRGDIRYEVDGDKLILKVKASALVPNEGGNSDLYIITSKDKTKSSDTNVYSALRTDLEIKNAILDFQDTVSSKYIRKDKDDFALGDITFKASIFVEDTATINIAFINECILSDKEANSYQEIIVEGENEEVNPDEVNNGFYLSQTEAWLPKLYVKKDAQFAGNLSSPLFISGFPEGYGWALTWRDVVNAAGVEAKKNHLELDDLTVRGILRVYEMVISQLLGENGTHLVTDMMKVLSVDTENKIIYLDTEEGVLYNPFWTDDIVMVQHFNGMPTEENGYYVTKQYEFVVAETHIGKTDEEGNRVDWIRYSNFVGDEALISPRDTLVRVDNLSNADRKGLIKETSVEPNSPYIDIIYGMKTDPENSVRTRFGKLEGIITPYWGRLEDYGIYCDNAFLRGKFMLETGEDIATKFEITEGKINAEIESIRYEISEVDNYLKNASFAKNTDFWEADNDIRFFTVNDNFLYFNMNFYSDKRQIAAMIKDKGKSVLRLKNSSIKQLNENIKLVEQIETVVRKTDENGQPVTDKDGNPIFEKAMVYPRLYLSFRYKCVTPGTLTFGFEGKELYLTESLEPTEDYALKEIAGVWDNEGDFVLSFTGDMYLYSVALLRNPIEDLRIEVNTHFEQTDAWIKLTAQKVTALIQETVQLGIEINAIDEKVELYAKKTNDLENWKKDASLKITPEAINAVVKSQVDEAAEFVRKEAVAAQQAAAKAQQTADSSAQRAADANARLRLWMEDGLISPTEKLTLKQEKKALDNEKLHIVADALKYGISTADYIRKFNEYSAELVYHSQAEPENIEVRSTFQGNQDAYYAAKQLILDQIAEGAKKYAEDKSKEAEQAAKDYADGISRVLTARLDITDAAISAVADETSGLGDTIRNSGWITQADGNKFWATRNEYNELGRRIGVAESKFSIEADWIKGTVSKVDALGNTIASAGWITEADGNKFWVKGTDYTGKDIVSKINQSADTVIIDAKHIQLNGETIARAIIAGSLQIDDRFVINRNGDLGVMEATVYQKLTVGIPAAGGFEVEDGELKAILKYYAGIDSHLSLSGKQLKLTDVYSSSTVATTYLGDPHIEDYRANMTGFSCNALFINRRPNLNSRTSNCAIYLESSGAFKNYGLISNSPCIAPSFISRELKVLRVSGTKPSFDFSTHTVYVMSATSRVSFSLPSKSEVEKMFWYSSGSLPSDFAILLTFIYDKDASNSIILQGLTNNNGGTGDVELGRGDVIQVLCANYFGFHYQIIQHRN